MSPIEMTGKTFGRLTVLRMAQKTALHRRWVCKCACGKEHTVLGTKLRSGESKSCGCGKAELLSASSLKHGHATRGVTATYRTWSGMISRCTNPVMSNYKNYGGRGITVCDRWRSFENFCADMGERPDGMSIERLDGNKGYEPDNCVWATKAIQSRNRRNSRKLEMDGVTKNITDWAKEYGIAYSVVHYRLSRGMTLKAALTTPIFKAKVAIRKLEAANASEI